MNNLTNLRKLKLLTQDDLAKKIGLKQNTISMWESGKSIPPYKTMQKMAEILDVDLQTIVNCFVKDKEKTKKE